MTYPVAQRRATTLQRRSVPSQVPRNANPMGYGTAPHPRRKRSGKAATSQSTPPQIDFPAPPPLSPAYDYCNPYATLPYCSLPDCSECQQQATSLIYAAPSTLYGTLGGGQRGASPHSSGGGDSSLYSGIYARKFGLSKKGLLQIDYSCSWNDLDRVMQRHFWIKRIKRDALTMGAWVRVSMSRSHPIFVLKSSFIHSTLTKKPHTITQDQITEYVFRRSIAFQYYY